MKYALMCGDNVVLDFDTKEEAMNAFRRLAPYLTTDAINYKPGKGVCVKPLFQKEDKYPWNK